MLLGICLSDCDQMLCLLLSTVDSSLGLLLHTFDVGASLLLFALGVGACLLLHAFSMCAGCGCLCCCFLLYTLGVGLRLLLHALGVCAGLLLDLAHMCYGSLSGVLPAARVCDSCCLSICCLLLQLKCGGGVDTCTST
jgi:hypothetical protein